MGKYVLKAVHIRDFPEALMKQKPRVNLEEFFRRAELTRGQADGIFTFVVEYEGDPICAFWMYHDLLYHQIMVDTFVLDKPWRSQQRTPFFLKIAQQTAEQVASMMAVNRITFVTPILDIMMKHFADPRMKVTQHVVSYDIEPEAS